MSKLASSPSPSCSGPRRHRRAARGRRKTRRRRRKARPRRRSARPAPSKSSARRAGRRGCPQGASAPSFVVDAGWPKPLPNNWIIGEVGGIAVDSHDHIWVYHRPRALDASSAGAVPRAATKDARRADQRARTSATLRRQLGLLRPGAVGARVRQGRESAQAWGGPADPGFLEKKCRDADGCNWPAREHGIFVDHNDFVYMSGNGEAAELVSQAWQVPVGAELRQRLAHPEVHGGRHVRLSDRHGRREGAEQQRHDGGPNGTPQPYLRGGHERRSEDEPPLHRGRLRQPTRADRRCRDREVHRPLRRLRAEPGRRRPELWRGRRMSARGRPTYQAAR